MTARKFLGIPLSLLLLSALAHSQTALTTSQNPSILGAPITLTATVTPSNATGRVTFYDGVTLLGSRPLSAGSASFLTGLLPSGSRKLKAYYSGDSNLAPATSNVVTQIVNAQPSSGSFAQGSSLDPYGGVVADFNGDGKADIATGHEFTVFTVLLGKGDGTFKSVFSGSIDSDFPIDAADFNGDGKADLLIQNLFSSKLSILLGNGDGTFQTPPLDLTTLSSPFFSVVVGDYNGDGKADFVVADEDTGVVSTLLGNGNGTFQPAITYPITFSPRMGITLGDLNGDGKTDLIITSFLSNTMNILLGNGDGTFQSPASVILLSEPAGVVVADFNKDGKPDLAIAQNTSPLVSIMLGKGDGTFQPPVTYPSGTNFAGLGIGDFNGDGNIDLALTYSGLLYILKGNGDGTFQAPSLIYQKTTPAFLSAVGEFNGDGKTDIIADAHVFLGTSMTVTATGGTPQSTPLGTAFPAQLQVTVRDGATLLSGATVTFVAPLSSAFSVPQFGPSATLSSDTAITDASGVARVTATANLRPGSYTVTASSLGLSASFSLTNLGSPAAISASGTPQFAVTGQPFPDALQVTVKDSVGNPLNGITVAFTSPASGAAAVLSSLTAVTNAFGVASVTATANNTLGSYTVTATAGTASTSFLLTNVLAGRVTLSTGKLATQSSTLSGYSTAGAASAVDGNNDGNFFHGSVAHTNLETNPWWQVDLGSSATVNSIEIWNRTDCCGTRLNDYWVFVSDTPFSPTDTPSTLQNRAGTFSSHQTTAPNPSIAIPVSAPGRYVRVQLTGANYLSLAEVLVTGSGAASATNMAVGKTTTQSSTLPGSSAAAAADGSTDGNFFNGSVTHTNQGTDPWWQVDLGASATVNSIVIWNRTDCCSTRLNDYWVFVSDTPFGPNDTPATLQNRAGTFSSHQTVAPNPSTTIPVSAQGRYVRVQLTGTNYLSIAEVLVMGTGAPSASNLAQGKAASQSSTLAGTAAAAVDGSTDGNYSNNSVTHSELGLNPWWQVDLGGSSAIKSIVIWNRTDCCSTRLSDYWVFVSDTPFNLGDTPANLQFRAGIFASHQTTVPSPSTTIPAVTQGRYVRVQLTGANYLSLAEVQVIGQ